MNKAEINERKRKEHYIQKGRTEITLKEHPVERNYEVLTTLLEVEVLQKWLQALTIDFKDFPIFRILNLHGSIWVNNLDDEGSSPSRTEFTWKDVQARAIQ